MKKIFSFIPLGFLGYLLSSCTWFYSSNKIVFANYQSYMSPWLTKKLSHKFNTTFSYFNVSEEVIGQYKLDNYDASVVTGSTLDTLISLGLVKKIDWSKFNLKNPETGASISSSTDALNLYIKPVREILEKTYKDKSNSTINLLDYGIPYFVQTFNFGYRGKKIPSLHTGDDDQVFKGSQPTPITWDKMIDTIARQDRFKSNSFPQLGMVEDYRTILSTAQLVKSNNVNYDNQGYHSISQLSDTYSNLVSAGLNKKSLGNKPIILNPDSNTLIDLLATGPNNKGIAGGFMYNGDLYYSANGGDKGVDIDPDDFHIVKNNNNLYALDLINISSSISDKKLDALYKLIKSISFEGLSDTDGMLAESSDAQQSTVISQSSNSLNPLDPSCVDDCQTYDHNVDSTGPDNGANEYKFAPAINFDYINYTPPIKKLYYELLGVKLENKSQQGSSPRSATRSDTSDPSSSTDPKKDKCKVDDNTSTLTQKPNGKHQDESERIITMLKECDDPKLDDVNKIIDKTYFYNDVQDLVFGKQDQASSVGYPNLEQLSTDNWSSMLTVANYPDDSAQSSTGQKTNRRSSSIKHSSQVSVRNQTPTSGQNYKDKITVTYTHYNPYEQSVTISYKQKDDDDSKIKTVTYSIQKSADENLKELTEKQKKKAKLLAEILIINSSDNISNLVERKFNDITNSNMLIAFNNLLANW